MAFAPPDSGKSVQRFKELDSLWTMERWQRGWVPVAPPTKTLVQEKHWREVFYWTILFLFFMIIMLFKCVKSCPLGAPTHSSDTYTGLDPTFTCLSCSCKRRNLLQRHRDASKPCRETSRHLVTFSTGVSNSWPEGRLAVHSRLLFGPKEMSYAQSQAEKEVNLIQELSFTKR